jgi:hypothetical protein
MLKAVEDFAVCAAVNPCTGDYLFAFNGFGGSFSIPIEPPLTFLVEDAGVKSVGWSSGNGLQTTVSAWDPMDLYMPWGGDLTRMKAKSFLVPATFRIEVGAKLGIGLEAPMKNYVKKLASGIGYLSINVMTEVTGLVAWGSSKSGSQLLIRGEAKPPSITLADIITIPALGAAGALSQKLTLVAEKRTSVGSFGTRGFVNVWLQYEAYARLADILNNINPFGSALAALCDSDDSAPVQLSGAIEVRLFSCTQHCSICMRNLVLLLIHYVWWMLEYLSGWQVVQKAVRRSIPLSKAVLAL